MREAIGLLGSALDEETDGDWKRKLTSKAVALEVTTFAKLSRDQRDELEAAVARFGDFLELETSLDLSVA